MDHEACEACGFDGSRYGDRDLLDALRALGPRWGALLSSCGNELRVRPGPTVWSAIEYAAHSRDVTALHLYGVEQALTGDEPVFPAIDGDALIESAASDYGDEDPVSVVERLEGASVRLAQLVDEVGVEAWSRGLTIGDDRQTVRRLLEHALHDSVHHLVDVEDGIRRLRSTPLKG